VTGGAACTPLGKATAIRLHTTHDVVPGSQKCRQRPVRRGTCLHALGPRISKPQYTKHIPVPCEPRPLHWDFCWDVCGGAAGRRLAGSAVYLTAFYCKCNRGDWREDAAEMAVPYLVQALPSQTPLFSADTALVATTVD
jgi:hypothetical protein